jgi:hypothetical protein
VQPCYNHAIRGYNFYNSLLVTDPGRYIKANIREIRVNSRRFFYCPLSQEYRQEEFNN